MLGLEWYWWAVIAVGLVALAIVKSILVPRFLAMVAGRKKEKEGELDD